MKHALAGVKVANFSWIAVGPLTIRFLALFGASVVRVETHTRPDLLRLMTPFQGGKPDLDKEPWFANVNSSAYSLSLNLNKPSGRDIAWRLIRWADIVAESFGAGTMQKWGLDYDKVKEVRPDIIYFSTSQLGKHGPYSSFVGFGYQAAALSGFTHVTGWPDRSPAPFQGALTDFISYPLGAAALLAALDYRRRTGEGQYIDHSQMESSVHYLAPQLIDYSINGNIAGRTGNRVPYAAPHGVYPCQGQDRWCAIAVLNDRQWRDLCQVMGHPQWADQGRFSTLLGRKQNEDELDRLIAGWTGERTAEDVEARLQGLGIPCSVVENTRDLFEDPQLGKRGFFRRLKHSAMGYHTYRGPAFRLPATPDCQFAGPALGEHNEWVCKELLGMADEEIAQALIDGGLTTEADVPDLRVTF